MIVSTYSIAACDLAAAEWGVAVQSKFLAVGSVVPWAAPEVGAIAITPDTLVVDDVSDTHSLHAAHVEGRPVVVRASTPEGVLHALQRPEVACVLVPESARELLDLDLVGLTYE